MDGDYAFALFLLALALLSGGWAYVSEWLDRR